MKRTSLRRSTLLWLVVAILTGTAGGLAAVRHLHTGMPFSPGEAEAVWTVEARVAFRGRGTAAAVELDLPVAAMRDRILEEDFVSRGFGLILDSGRDGTRTATWTQRRVGASDHALYYQARVLGGAVFTADDVPPFPDVPAHPEPVGSAIEAVLARAPGRSADVFSFAAQLIDVLNDPRDENVVLIRRLPIGADREQLLVQMLAGARIPARIAWGFPLDAGFTEERLRPWLEVHNGNRWQAFDAMTGQRGYPPDFFIWSYTTDEPVRARKVRDPTLAFSVTKTFVPREQIGVAGGDGRAAPLAFDLSDLPVATRNLFDVALMIPLGALVVALMRTVIGIPTFGTFMPVLIALAFRETHLVWGIVMFLVLTFTGLAIRAALSRLRLLLVPRLTAVLIVVVLLMLTITSLSARLGLEQGLSVGLFPMVILAMTIERMSILADEHGMVATLRVTAGSLAVAVCGYFVMNEPVLVYLIGHYPELLLGVLGATIGLGAYTGYRLTELGRFRDLARGPRS